MFDVYFAFHMKLRKLHFFWKGVARAYVATLYYALVINNSTDGAIIDKKYAVQ